MSEGSVVGPSTVIRGNVRGEGSVEIYGRVEGDVDVTGDVTVGEQASVRGDVNGARITVGGTVQGDLIGTEAVVLERTAQITGDIAAPRLGVEEGALVRGALRMEVATAPAGPRVVEQRRPAPRQQHPIEARRPEPAPRINEAPRGTAAPVSPAAPQRKQPPAPVVPAFRGLQARKKKVRAR